MPIRLPTAAVLPPTAVSARAATINNARAFALVREIGSHGRPHGRSPPKPHRGPNAPPIRGGLMHAIPFR